VASISAIVQNAEEESEGVVSLAVASLVELKAVEVLPLIRRAFELGKVDESVPGTWGSVLADLGVEPDPDDLLVEESRRRFEERHARMFPRGPFGRAQAAPSQRAALSQRPAPSQKSRPEQARKEKNKRKAAKASRKANRKKRK
jgi:hypothetical protein